MYLPEFLNLGTGFSKYFRAVPALTDDLRRAAFSIRHSVYCEELGYEPVRPEKLEFDEHDEHAAHCLLQSVRTAEFVGCVRLIFPEVSDPSQPLPFERLCESSLNRATVDPARLNRTKIAEVSRLAVAMQYRRRKGEQKVALPIAESDFGTPDRPRFPYIAAGLYLAMIAQARHHQIEKLFMLTERRLARQLSRLGVNLRTIGGPIQHRGTRYPSMMVVQEVIDGLHFFVRPLFAVISSEMDLAYKLANVK